jgi:catechol-2,3-dioxygenase
MLLKNAPLRRLGRHHVAALLPHRKRLTATLSPDGFSTLTDG